MCHGSLVPARARGAVPVGRQDDGLVLGAAEDRPAADVVDDQQVASLARELGRGQLLNGAGVVAGLDCESDDHLPVAGAMLRDLLEDVRVLLELDRSEEHTSELQSLMRLSYAVFCLKKQ